MLKGDDERDLSKCYDQVRLGLAVAGAAGQSEAFAEELRAANERFKGLAATEFVRLQKECVTSLGQTVCLS